MKNIQPTEFESMILMNQAQIMNVMRALITANDNLAPEDQQALCGLLQTHIDITARLVKEGIDYKEENEE